MENRSKARTAERSNSAVRKNNHDNKNHVSNKTANHVSNKTAAYKRSNSGRRSSLGNSKSYRKKKNARYRRIKFYYNLIFTLIVIFVVIYGAFHIFTKKKSYRNDGLDYYNKGEYEAAIESFNKALNCNQWFSDAVDIDILMYKADAYVMLSDFASAERTYASIKTKYPKKYYDSEKIDFMVELTNALDRYKFGDYVSTVACFNRAVEAGYTEMSMYAACCYEQAGDYEKMKSNLDIYTGSFGYNADICYKYAAYYIDVEDYEDALSSIEQGLSFGESTYTQEFMYAQIICHIRLCNFDKASELANVYAQTYPDDTKGQDIMAWLDTRTNPDTEVVNDIFNQNSLNVSSDETADDANSTGDADAADNADAVPDGIDSSDNADTQAAADTVGQQDN